MLRQGATLKKVHSSPSDRNSSRNRFWQKPKCRRELIEFGDSRIGPLSDSILRIICMASAAFRGSHSEPCASVFPGLGAFASPVTALAACQRASYPEQNELLNDPPSISLLPLGLAAGWYSGLLERLDLSHQSRSPHLSLSFAPPCSSSLSCIESGIAFSSAEAIGSGRFLGLPPGLSVSVGACGGARPLARPPM